MSAPRIVRAFRVRSGRVIAPFGDGPRDLVVGTRRIEAWQAAAVRAVGMTLVDVDEVSAIDGPGLVFWDDVFFTEMALRQFVADTLGRTTLASAALPDSPASRALAPLQDARELPGGGRAFDLFVVPDPSRAPLAEGREALRAAAEPVVQALRERAIPVRLPREDRAHDAPLTARLLCHVRHWVHLLRLSQLSIGVALIDALKQHPARLFGLRWAARRGPWAVARKLVFVHPTAEVHPTADLEAAVIGPGAVVRAHAHVHASVLGSGVDIGDHAVVVGCSLADKVQVLRASYFAHVAAMEQATLANYKAQLSLFGRGSFLTTSALLLDAKLTGDVSVEHEGRVVNLGTPYLGVCLGHRAQLGAQVAVAPGRAVPNDAIVVGHEVALRFPTSVPGEVWTVRDGRVGPLPGR